MGQVIAVVAVVLLIAVGSFVLYRLMSSPADDAVAMTGRGAEKHRDDVEAAASRHGWHVRRGDAVGARTWPPDLQRGRVPAEECELVVEGRSPRPFTAETWRVRPTRVGGAPGTGRQNLVTMQLARPVPRFAVGKASLLGHAWEVLPDDLLPRDEQPAADGVQVWGDDQGLAAWLRPVLPEVLAAEVWLVLHEDRLAVVRAGEPDAAGLAERVALAGRVADAVDAAGRAG